MAPSPSPTAGGDTIVALATPWGHAALALLRLSGPDAGALGRRLCCSPDGPRWVPRRASLRRALDAEGGLIDELLVTWMPGPATATGEDVLELGCHGNPLVVEQLLDRCVALGARPARPGEFTRRAVLHGRMDLMGAEALHALITARSAAGLDAARQGLDGALAAVLAGLRDRMLSLAAELEVRLDHPGEDLGAATDDEVIAGLGALSAELGALSESWRAGRRRLEGARVALVGPVNAGKSSLFNRLVGMDRALVSAEPGTTRDVVERAVVVDGLEILFLDTAGDREAHGVEAAGQALARSLTADVDLRLHVVSALAPPTPAALAALPPGGWLVATHTDRGPVPAHLGATGRRVFGVSNPSGDGIDALRQALRAQLGADPSGAAAVVLSQRQHALLRDMAARCAEAADCLGGMMGPVVAAEALTRGLQRLAELTGDDVREDVLDRLFSRFCIGK